MMMISYNQRKYFYVVAALYKLYLDVKKLVENVKNLKEIHYLIHFELSLIDS